MAGIPCMITVVVRKTGPIEVMPVDALVVVGIVGVMGIWMNDRRA